MAENVEQAGGVYDSRADATKADTAAGREAAEIRLWIEALALSDKDEEDWRKGGRDAIAEYRAQKGKSRTTSDGGEAKTATFPILYSNVETLHPAVYNSTPTPDVRRRFRDEDPIGKQVAQVIERSLSFTLDAYDFDSMMNAAVQDMLLPGRGVSRVRYVPTMSGEELAYQAVTCEAVQWDEFRRGPAKRWEDVPWIAFKHYLTREQVTALNDKLGATIELDTTLNGDQRGDDKTRDQPNDVFKRLAIWEIWDKDTRKVKFLAPSHKAGFVLVEDDPLGLKDFWPVPRPLQGVTTTDSLVPVIEYEIYRSQAEELNRLSVRIQALIKVIRWRGAYASEFRGFERIQELSDGELAPLEESISVLREGGSLTNAIWLMPIKEAVAVLETMVQQREIVKQVIFEITGIADIMRGQTNPNETKGAQQLKAQWGSLRVQRRQAEVARYARDILRLKSEIIASKFAPQILTMMTGVQVDEQVEQALRNASERQFRIDVETDSTIRADLNQAQQNIGQFVQGTGQYFQALGPAVQSGAMPPDVAIDIFAGFARVFKIGKQAEDAIDRWSQEAKDQAQQAKANPQPPKPSPEQEKLALEEKVAAAAAQRDAAKMQAEQQRDAVKLQMEAEARQQELAFKQQEHEQSMAMEMQKHQAAVEMQRDKMAMDKEAGQQKMAIDAESRDKETDGKFKLERDKWQAEGAPGPDFFAQFKEIADALGVNQRELAARVEEVAKLAAKPRKSTIVRGRDGKATHAMHEIMQ